MTVRCKFTCNSVAKLFRRRKEGFVYEAEFGAVYEGKENEAFFEATPSGSLKIGHYKEDLFTPGRDYYIDISEV